MPEKRPDDLEALEKALNASASSVNTLWVAFVTSSIYFLIAIGSVTHRHLLLEIPIKLPIFNVELPLVGFFVISPILLVAFHLYVVLQLHGLALKCADYDSVLRNTVPLQSDRRLMRQRLDMFVFIQALVGVHARRTRLLGYLLHAILLLTLAGGPLALLLFMQCAFLPYHDAEVTWVHRSALIADVVVVFFFSNFAMMTLDDAAVRRNTDKTIAEQQYGLRSLRWLWNSTTLVLAVSVTVVAASLTVLTFPGEFIYHYRLRPLSTLLLEGPIDGVTGQASTKIANRIVLPDQTLIDADRLTKPGTSISLRGRDFQAAIFDRSDLRSADFTGANLSLASLRGANLQGAQFGCANTRFRPTAGEPPGISSLKNGEPVLAATEQCANLNGAILDGARLQWADFDSAALNGASFTNADLTRSSFFFAKLRGAWLSEAKADLAYFDSAYLEGAVLSRASLLGASFYRAKMRGASLLAANLQGAIFEGADLQNVNIAHAHLYASSLDRKQIEGGEYETLIWVEHDDSSCPSKELAISSWNRVDTTDAIKKLDRRVRATLPSNLKNTPEVAEVLEEEDFLNIRRLESSPPERINLGEANTSDKRDDAERFRTELLRSVDVTVMTNKRNALAADLKKIACSIDGAPHVARGLLNNQRILHLGPSISEIHEAFKDPVSQKCPGALELSQADIEKLGCMMGLKVHLVRR